jgi:hypothetical protein
MSAARSDCDDDVHEETDCDDDVHEETDGERLFAAINEKQHDDLRNLIIGHVDLDLLLPNGDLPAELAVRNHNVKALMLLAVGGANLRGGVHKPGSFGPTACDNLATVLMVTTDFKTHMRCEKMAAALRYLGVDLAEKNSDGRSLIDGNGSWADQYQQYLADLSGPCKSQLAHVHLSTAARLWDWAEAVLGE